VNISELIQQLATDALVELFEIDTTVIGGTDHFYFHAGTNKLNGPVVWQGITYNPWPIEAEGFDKTVKGALPRPRVRVANALGAISAVVMQWNDLVGARVTRRQTFSQYLDAVNFPGGVNATADPGQFLPDDVFYVERKIQENKVIVEFELASAMDLQDQRLPNRMITADYCWWQYRGEGCGYAGTAYFNALDQSVSSASQDICSQTPTGCKKRFGERALLPFGGFPGARSYKL
jgi:lambda family phage minor tail protein L